MIDVSVIIVNYNTQKMTAECIESIFEKTKGIAFEIILVDNASNDGSKEFFKKDRRIRYIYNDENLGFGKANNIGVDVAQGRNIFFLNSDTLLVNNAIKILSDYLDSHGESGICGGNLFNSEMEPIHSFQMFYPTIMEELNELLKCIPTALFKTDRSQFNNTGQSKEVAYITGADLMIKKELIEKYGAFNSAFFMYFEETELCHRIKKAGYMIMSVPDAHIIHLCGKSTKKATKNKMYIESKRRYYGLTHDNDIMKKIYNILVSLH